MARQIDSLQILRGIAATLVVFDHVVSASLHQFGHTNADLRALWFAGALGVQIFFCISGYIITLSLLAESREPQSILDFYRRRCIRVVPLYWLATIVYSVRLVTKGAGPDVDELLRSFLFIPYADANGQMRPIFGLGWSLNFEMFFYLVLGQALWLRSRWGPATVTALVLVPLWLLALWLPAAQLLQVLPDSLALLIDPVLGYFLAGVVLAYVAPVLQRARAIPWPGTGPVAALLALCSGGLVAVVLVQPHWLSVAEILAVPLAVGSVLLCALQPDEAQRPAWLTRVAKRFGDASYSTYLSHAFLVTSVAAVLAQLPFVAEASMGGIAVWCVLLLPLFNLAGLVVHTWVEKPLISLCSARMGGRPRTMSTPP